MPRENGTAGAPVKRMLAAVVGFCIIACAMLLAAAALIGREVLPNGVGKVYVIAALVAASCFSSAVIARGRQTAKAAAIGISFVLAEVVLIAAGLILGGGRLDAEAAGVSALSVAVGSITGCIMSIGRKRRVRKR